MRFHFLTLSVFALVLSGCAFEGTVVEKRSRPLPDASMIGTEGVHSFVFRGPTGTSRPPIGVPHPQFWTETNGVYSFLLRDQQGNVRSQMVTAEVYARCRVGDYFNDRGPACAPPDSKDSKTVTAVLQRRRHRQVAQARRTHRQVSQTRRTHRKVVKHRRHHSTKSRKVITLRSSRAVPHG